MIDMNEYMKKRWRKRRRLAINYLGGECVSCGTDIDLEFDHINPAEKDFTIARASSFSEERFWKEVDKCQLLCGDCHKEKHMADHMCGDVKKYWRGCKCELCRSAATQHNREYRASKKK